MAVEIERKFLVVGDAWRAQAQRSLRLIQGYLTPPGRSPSAMGRSPSAPEAMDGREGPAEVLDGRERTPAGSGGSPCSIRVRIGGDSAWLSIKSAVTGVERREYEYAIPPGDAELMLAEFCGSVLEKVRHYVPHGGAMFEVDEFLGDNAGLVVAELELGETNEEFPRPPWLGREVSDLLRYYNVHLLQHPYSRWSMRERAGD
jgi:adenylate cyclase